MSLGHLQLSALGKAPENPSHFSTLPFLSAYLPWHDSTCGWCCHGGIFRLKGGVRERAGESFHLLAQSHDCRQ